MALKKEELEKLLNQAKEGIEYVGQRSDAEHDVVLVSIAASLLVIAENLQNSFIYTRSADIE